MFWYPHIKDGGAGSANYSFGTRNARSAFCEKCAGAYRLLDLSQGASKEEIKSKKWAFAELFSADRLRAMSEQARQLAEEQHKSINAACDQILRCPDCTRLRDDLNGSESRPAPCQPKRALPAQEASKPQPDKYFPAEQVLAILKETNDKINAITFVREQTGWGLKEAEGFVDFIAPEWRPAPEQAAGATTKQEESKAQPDKYSPVEEEPAILKRPNNKINAITFVKERVGWGLREAKNFVDFIAPDWHPAPEQAAGATTKQEAFGETSPCKFSVKIVILVTILLAGTLIGWNWYSMHEAQMEAENRQLLYQEQLQQGEQQRERAKEEQLRQRQEACAERSAARRQNSANGGKPASSHKFFVDASTTGIQRDRRFRVRATVP
jgi:ribosomal protein L7/L12